MKIYTIVETEESFSIPLSVKVLHSDLFLPFARNALVNRIVKRAQEDLLFSYVLWDDVNHSEEFREYMRENTGREDIESYFCRDDDDMKFPEDVERVMCSFLLENVVGEEAYHVFLADKSEHMVHFDIIENELMEGVPNEV